VNNSRTVEHSPDREVNTSDTRTDIMGEHRIDVPSFHQGLANELIDRPATRTIGADRRRQRVGGILSYYYRSAA
jgi:hypothetical protein